MAAKLKSAVLGASGYSGLELTRILERHPRLEKPALLRREGGADRSGGSGGSVSGVVGQRGLSVAGVLVG